MRWGSMGVTVCAVYPSGPVSREIRLTRWCRVLIINEPNFIVQQYLRYMHVECKEVDNDNVAVPSLPVASTLQLYV